MTQTYPARPQGWQRSQLEALLIEIAPALDLGAKRLAALLYMMGKTKPGDWTSRESEPVYYAPQADTALALGKTDRALRNDERALQDDLGFIERRVKANGSRSFYGMCGIVFSRLIARVPELIALREQIQTERAHRRDLVQRRSSYLRHMNRGLLALSPALGRSAEAQALRAALDAWPHSSRLRGLALDALEAHLAQARALCEQLDDLLEYGADSSGAAEENFRPHIQENTHENSSVICNAHVGEKPSAYASEDNSFGSGPYGPAHCKENEYEAESEAFKKRFARNLTTQQLYDLASSVFRHQVDHNRAGRAEIRYLDLVDAAHDMLPFLGINYSAWTEAAQLMGPEGAAVCVLIIDANQDHPTAPVRNPGGALRAWTRRARAGRLNLVGSLIGLSRRRGR